MAVNKVSDALRSIGIGVWGSKKVEEMQELWPIWKCNWHNLLMPGFGVRKNVIEPQQILLLGKSIAGMCFAKEKTGAYAKLY